MMIRAIVLVSTFALLPAPSAFADSIATDRPDFVESSATVGQGRWQIETSLAWERDDDGAFEAHTWSTPTLLRYGVSEHWELRLESDGRIDAGWRGPGLRVDERGMADLSVGLKYHVPDSGANGGPSMAWLMHIDLDTGSGAFRGDGARPSLRLVAEWELPNDMSVGVMPGVIYDNGDNGRYAAGILGVVVGKGWSDRFRTFVELALPQIAGSDDGGTQAALDLGAAYLVNDNVQWDIATSMGLNARTPDFGLTTGLSIRW